MCEVLVATSFFFVLFLDQREFKVLARRRRAMALYDTVNKML